MRRTWGTAQIVQRVKDQLLTPIAAPMPCDLLTAGADDHFVHIGITIATVQNPTLRSAGPEAIRQCPT